MKNLICLIVFALTLSACGGGGGSDSGVPFYGGVYDVNFELQSHNCNQSGLVPFTSVLTVNQDALQVVVETSTGATLRGNATDTGFSVSRADRELDGCQGTPVSNEDRLDYTYFDGKKDLMVLARSNRCDGSVITCTATYIGDAKKR